MVLGKKVQYTLTFNIICTVVRSCHYIATWLLKRAHCALVHFWCWWWQQHRHDLYWVHNSFQIPWDMAQCFSVSWPRDGPARPVFSDKRNHVTWPYQKIQTNKLPSQNTDWHVLFSTKEAQWFWDMGLVLVHIAHYFIHIEQHFTKQLHTTKG